MRVTMTKNIVLPPPSSLNFGLRALAAAFVSSLFAFSANAEYWTGLGVSMSFNDSANWNASVETKTAYIGTKDSGYDDNDQIAAITLDDNINVRNLYWGGEVFKNPATTAPELNTGLPSGISSSGDYTITVSYGTSDRQFVVYKGHSEDIIFSNNFNFTGTGGNTYARFSSDCNTTFSDGYTFTSDRNITFYMYRSTKESVVKNVYLNSKITITATMCVSGYDGIAGGYAQGELILGGTQSNTVNGLAFYNNGRITFAKTGGAYAFLGNGSSGSGDRSIFLCGAGYSNDSYIKYSSSDQVYNSRWVLYTHQTDGQTARGGIILDNGSSQNVGGIHTFILSNHYNYTGKLDAYVDFTKNSVAQVFATRFLSTAGTIKSGDDYLIEFSLYNFGEDDKFVLGSQMTAGQKAFTKIYSDDGSTLISWDDIVESFYGEYDGVNYYSYSVIPEPATFAAVLAAAALAFAAYRRKK